MSWTHSGSCHWWATKPGHDIMEVNNMDFYRRHIAAANKEIAVLRRAVNTYSFFRLGTVIGGGAALFVAVQTEQVWLVMAVFFAILLLFMGLVWRQSKLEKEKARLTDFVAVNQNELDVAARKPNRYADGSVFKDKSHPYSEDLDVFGPSSLFALTNRCATLQGNQLLGSWFSKPTDAATIPLRQDAIRELADDMDWCQQFQVNLWFNLTHPEDFKQRFAQFVADQQLAFGNKYLRMYVKAAPWLMGVVVGLAFFMPFFASLTVFMAITHLLWSMYRGVTINRIAGQVDKAGRLLGAFSEGFKLIENRKWKSRLNGEFAARLAVNQGAKSTSAAFSELATLIERLDYRLNMLVGAVLNMVALWDFKQVFALLDWRKRYGADILNAFDVAAEFEALVSLSILTYNHPQWNFPVIADTPTPVIEGVGLSHPLLPARVSVANDYDMDHHRIALITGSNMAGKSTFLRTIGSNAVLAFCGAPICGVRMQLSVFHLVSYMRIADSLNESTSTFKAELNRIQMVLQTVKNQSGTFFLIDEMLRGTNSVDKYLGSKAIIKQLIAAGGVGMVATHDLQLAKLADEYPEVVANYHFDIQVREGDMLFDYKLKEGACTVFNASMLLRNIGIDVDE